MKYSVIPGSGDAELIVVRGLPGSGKSSFAKTLTDTLVIESDMWWYRNPQLEYQFDFDLLSRAHRWALQSAEAFLADGRCVAVANTNLTFREAKGYVAFAKAIGCPISVYTMDKGVNYGSIHGVPKEVMVRMHNKMESHEVFMEKAIAYQPDGTEGICRDKPQAGLSEGVQAASGSVRTEV
jgi:predicted kinase